MKNIIVAFIIFILIGCTPGIDDLYNAIEEQNLQEISRIIDSNGTGENFDLNSSILSRGIKTENHDLILLLLESGCSTEISSDDLDVLLKKNNITLLFKMIDYGLDPNILYNEEPIIFWIIESNNTELLKKIILSGADINKTNPNIGINAFHYAFNQLDFSIIKFMVENGADLKMRDKYGRTIFSKSITSKNIQLVNYLISKGIDYSYAGSNQENQWEELALNWIDDYIKLADLYWRDGLRLDLPGNRSLHIAAMYYHLEYVKWLLDHGSDPYEEDEMGETPGSYAYMNVKLSNETDQSIRDELYKKAEKINDLLDRYNK